MTSAGQAVIDVLFTAGKDKAPALKDGKARLTVAAQSNDFLGRSASISSEIEVITTPPRVSVDGFQHYINQGGSELVTFTASGYWTEAGVRVGKYTFRSFPMPGAKSQNAALRAVRLSLGSAAATSSRRSTCATPPAPRRTATSGSSCSPRNSAPRTSSSPTR